MTEYALKYLISTDWSFPVWRGQGVMESGRRSSMRLCGFLRSAG